MRPAAVRNITLPAERPPGLCRAPGRPAAWDLPASTAWGAPALL